MSKAHIVKGQSATLHGVSIADLKAMLASVDEAELSAIERAMEGDTRVGVAKAIEAARRRIDAQIAERERVRGLFNFERAIAHKQCPAADVEPVIVGLDEVGRGPLAGPLAVGAVVFSGTPCINGLNDSKQVPEPMRPVIAEEIKQVAACWSVQFVEPQRIDAVGMSRCLKDAFLLALQDIERQGTVPDVVLIDGNPLHIDEREVTIVKGDASCASIAAASILAKTARDERMVAYASAYPEYGFARNKGYGSEAHREAIARYGLSPIHRRSFCSSYYQETLF